jgi:hypothetical protein
MSYSRPFFVTNSSSTHSVVILNRPRQVGGQAGWKPGHFGWQPFVLSRPEDKMVYMAVMLLDNILSLVPYEDRDYERAIKQVNKAVNKHKPTLDENESYHIDHQSRIVLPLVPNAKVTINLPFFRDLCNYVVKNDRLVVLGGNDNSDDIIRVAGEIGGDPIWAELYDEGFKDVYAYHLDKPRKWKLMGKDWDGKTHQKVIQIPEVTND